MHYDGYIAHGARVRGIDMIDFSSRDTLPKDDFDKVAIPHTIIEPSGLLEEALVTKLRDDYYECCRFLLDVRQYARYGDDDGDYQNGAAHIACVIQHNFSWALWHSELNTEMIDELNKWLNCTDEEHCIHIYAIDGPDLWLDRVSIHWESCPNMQ